ncbi:MAG: HEPN domain-containing protein, partial [Candidatus Helarchaeota archaeon]
LKEDIFSIILFGSLIENQVTRNSDIDILVIHFGDKNVENKIHELTFQFISEKQVPIEVVLYNVFDYLFNPSYFLINIRKKGDVLFMVDDQVAKKKIIKALFNLSRSFQEDATECFKMKRYRATIDLGYNSIELAVKGLLLKEKDDLPGSHGGLIAKFGELFVLTNKIPNEIGKKINQALASRNKARYDPEVVITENDSKFILDLRDELEQYLST